MVGCVGFVWYDFCAESCCGLLSCRCREYSSSSGIVDAARRFRGASIIVVCVLGMSSSLSAQQYMAVRLKWTDGGVSRRIVNQG